MRDRSPRRVLVTGGSSGIGLATALRYAGHGARIGLIARGRDGLGEAASRVAAAGAVEVVTEPGDVSDRGSIVAAIRAVAERLGGLDLVVVNAGIGSFGSFRQTAPEEFDRVIAVTLTGVANTVRPALEELETSGGSLIVVGSAAADLPLPMMAAYTAAKHGVRGLLDTLRVELRAEGSPVSVSLVEPGPVDSPFWNVISAQSGRLPPHLPLAYAPGEVARAIELADRRGLARVAIGGMTVAASALHRRFRPVSDRAIAAGAKLVLGAARSSGSEPDATREPTGAGDEGGGLGGRASLLIRVRSAIGDGLARLTGAP